jgi:hypothetical protein
MRTALAVAMLLLLTSMTMVAQGTGSTTLSGYVVDQDCAGKIATKANVMEKAAGHTKDCALMEDCAASGFGIFSDGKYYKFDTKGSATAKALFEKSKHTKAMYFTAVGKLDDGTLTVASLVEAVPPKGTEKPKEMH